MDDVNEIGDGIKGAVDAEKILGKNGTKFESKTTWQNGKTERIDIEKKQFYNQKTGKLAPKKIQKLLKDKDVINAINKGLKFLGEDKLK
ncbi:hypothetical protein UT300007_27320 [Clostridium sp. CTA-7]